MSQFIIGLTFSILTRLIQKIVKNKKSLWFYLLSIILYIWFKFFIFYNFLEIDDWSKLRLKNSNELCFETDGVTTSTSTTAGYSSLDNKHPSSYYVNVPICRCFELVPTSKFVYARSGCSCYAQWAQDFD